MFRTGLVAVREVLDFSKLSDMFKIELVAVREVLGFSKLVRHVWNWVSCCQRGTGL